MMTIVMTMTMTMIMMMRMTMAMVMAMATTTTIKMTTTTTTTTTMMMMLVMMVVVVMMMITRVTTTTTIDTSILLCQLHQQLPFYFPYPLVPSFPLFDFTVLSVFFCVPLPGAHAAPHWCFATASAGHYWSKLPPWRRCVAVCHDHGRNGLWKGRRSPWSQASSVKLSFDNVI